MAKILFKKAVQYARVYICSVALNITGSYLGLDGHF